MSQPLNENEISQALNDMPGWSYDDSKITKKYHFKHFREAMSFLVRVGFEAEAVNHHPTMKINWNIVKISLNTHDAGDKVTEHDLSLAKRIEHLSWTDKA